MQPLLMLKGKSHVNNGSYQSHWPIGQVGHCQLQQPVAHNGIITLVRNPAKAAALGVTALAGRLCTARGLGHPAGRNRYFGAAFFQRGWPARAAQHANAIQAEKNKSVRHIIYTRLLHADTSPSSLAQEHRVTRTNLKAIGIPCSISHNGWCTENYLDSLVGALGHGALISGVGQGRIASGTRADFAQTIAVVAIGTGHANTADEVSAQSGEKWSTPTCLKPSMQRHWLVCVCQKV